MKFILLFLLINFNLQLSFSQIIKKDNYGITFGLSANIGTHVNRIGIFAGGYFIINNNQLNIYKHTYYTFKNLGPKGKTPEFQLSLSYLWAYGKTDPNQHYQFSEISNNTTRKNSIGITYTFYLDKLGCTQRTGWLSLEFDKIIISHENDMFGAPRSDKFRSAGVMIAYTNFEYMPFINVTLWHGDAFDKKVKKITDSDYPARFAYKNLSEAKYGKLSHGILSLGMRYSDKFGQNYEISTGIDSEKVRHAVQNKAIHDLWFVPPFLITYELEHYPMLQKDGTPYLFLPDQKIKKSKYFLDFSLNSSFFY